MKLTARRRQLLEAIIAHIEKHHVVPTVRELAPGYGATRNAVHEQLRALARLGYVRFPFRKHRQLVVLKTPDGEPHIQVPLEKVGIDEKQAEADARPCDHGRSEADSWTALRQLERRPPDDVVGLFEDMLAMARAGKIRGALVALHSDDPTLSGGIAARECDVVRLLGEVEWVKFRYLQGFRT